MKLKWKLLFELLNHKKLLLRLKSEMLKSYYFERKLLLLLLLSLFGLRWYGLLTVDKKEKKKEPRGRWRGRPCRRRRSSNESQVLA